MKFLPKFNSSQVLLLKLRASQPVDLGNPNTVFNFYMKACQFRASSSAETSKDQDKKNYVEHEIKKKLSANHLLTEDVELEEFLVLSLASSASKYPIHHDIVHAFTTENLIDFLALILVSYRYLGAFDSTVVKSLDKMTCGMLKALADARENQVNSSIGTPERKLRIVLGEFAFLLLHAISTGICGGGVKTEVSAGLSTSGIILSSERQKDLKDMAITFLIHEVSIPAFSKEVERWMKEYAMPFQL